MYACMYVYLINAVISITGFSHTATKQAQHEADLPNVHTEFD